MPAAASYVYVISGDHGRQKIGSSDDPGRRIKELQTGSPYQLRFEFIGETEERAAGAVEVQAHFMLNEHKAPGGDEWFVVPPDVAITAVMAAAHRLGYAVKPVDPDAVQAKSYTAPTWHHVMTGLAAIPALLAMIWLIRAFDGGQMHAVAFIICGAVLIGLMKLLRFFLIRLGNTLISLDRVMQSGERIKLPD